MTKVMSHLTFEWAVNLKKIIHTTTQEATLFDLKRKKTISTNKVGAENSLNSSHSKTKRH